MGFPIEIWRDGEVRGAPQQMAIDEALLRLTDRPVIRFYRWKRPAITFGYFISWEAVQGIDGPAEKIRRWTGGGVVEHGEDVTFSLAVPAAAEGRRESAGERYRWIHECLASALNDCGIDAAAIATPSRGMSHDADRCFSAAVAWDVVDPASGSKLAGGAQRRSRHGWLHQGSVRLPNPENRIDSDWTGQFCEALANGAMEKPTIWEPPVGFRKQVDRLVRDRYGSAKWNQSR